MDLRGGGKGFCDDGQSSNPLSSRKLNSILDETHKWLGRAKTSLGRTPVFKFELTPLAWEVETEKETIVAWTESSNTVTRTRRRDNTDTHLEEPRSPFDAVLKHSRSRARRPGRWERRDLQKVPRQADADFTNYVNRRWFPHYPNADSSNRHRKEAHRRAEHQGTSPGHGEERRWPERPKTS